VAVTQPDSGRRRWPRLAPLPPGALDHLPHRRADHRCCSVGRLAARARSATADPGEPHPASRPRRHDPGGLSHRETGHRTAGGAGGDPVAPGRGHHRERV